MSLQIREECFERHLGESAGLIQRETLEPQLCFLLLKNAILLFLKVNFAGRQM